MKKDDPKTWLTDEVTKLAKKQCHALETSAYVNMSKVETKAFDRRCKQLEKMGQLLGHPLDES